MSNSRYAMNQLNLEPNLETYKKSFQYESYLDDETKVSLKENLLKDIYILYTELKEIEIN